MNPLPETAAARCRVHARDTSIGTAAACGCNRPLSSQVWAFLGTPPDQACRLSIDFSRSDIPQVHDAIERVFSGLVILRRTTWSWFPQEDDWGPEYVNFRLVDGTYRSLLVCGLQFCEMPNGERLVLNIHPELGPRNHAGGYQLELFGRGSDQGRLHRQLQAIESLIRTLPHFLHRQIVTADETVLDPRKPAPSLDDVALPDDVRTSLLQNTVDLILRREEYRRWGIPLTRGIILHGPPGNGKSMIGRALAGMNLATFVHGNPEKLSELGVGHLFRMARRLSPAFVFLEDIDFLGGQDQRRFGSPRFAELLVQLDGLDRNDGLIIIATTNNLEAIDPAIRERPSRFDVVIRIDNPDSNARRQIIQRQIGHLIEPALVNTATELTNGLSGAQVREVCIRAGQQALHAGLAPTQLTSDHFQTAIQSLYHTPPKKPAGFRATADVNPSQVNTL